MKAQPRLIFLVVAIFLIFIISNFSYALSGGHYKSHSSGSYRASHITHSRVHSGGSYSRSHVSGHRSSKYSTMAKRDSHGRIARSEYAKRQFMRQTGYPHGRKGYVVDHIVPLKCGGADSQDNMQWQTKEAAKAKDKWE